jgi:hypothetical protein
MGEYQHEHAGNPEHDQKHADSCQLYRTQQQDAADKYVTKGNPKTPLPRLKLPGQAPRRAPIQQERFDFLPARAGWRFWQEQVKRNDLQPSC